MLPSQRAMVGMVNRSTVTVHTCTDSPLIWSKTVVHVFKYFYGILGYSKYHNKPLLLYRSKLVTVQYRSKPFRILRSSIPEQALTSLVLRTTLRIAKRCLKTDPTNS